MDGLDLRHDVLDAQLQDYSGENIGRCDALLLELRDGRPPRVATVLIGGPARRERMGRWVTALARVFSRTHGAPDAGVSRIPFARVQAIGHVVQLDVKRSELPSEHVEQWLTKHVICHIPGAEGKKERVK